MRNKQSRLLLLVCVAITFVIAAVISCNKKFDAPPYYIPPNITANTSIKDLKDKHMSGQVDSITDNMIISGVVIANDSSGNFYKQIIIEDSTGGIAIDIDDYNLYATYPVGRKVYVKVQGLFMSETSGLIFIGGAKDNRSAVSGIASRLVSQYITKGEINVPVTPDSVSIALLTQNPTKYMYRLVQLKNFEVTNSDTLKTYAYSNGATTSDASIFVKGCSSSDSIIIRTSGYSYFANVYVPKGNGTLTAVYAYYKSPYNSKITPQVIIRDTSDVQFTGSRCDGTTPPPPSNATLKTISEIRALYKGSGIKIDSNYRIGGVVISDVANGNISSSSVILQDGNRGISVYFGSTLTYKLGDSVVVDITPGDSLLSYNGSLEIKKLKGSIAPAAVASGKTVTPVELTIKQLNSTISDVEYTLVKINNATASGQANFYVKGTFASLTDASDNVELYTSQNASFASQALPSGAKDWVGYANTYGSFKEFQIRNLNDITDATGGGTDTTVTLPPPTTGSDLIISEYVEGSSSNKYLEIYNAGSAAADLSLYAVKLYANGVTTPTNQAKLDTLTGLTSLPAGGIIVLQNSSAALTLPSGVTAYNSSVCNFNGDDALTLEKSGAIIDVFGTAGIDPGSSWTIAGDATGALDHTVRRKTSVTQGNTNWTSSSAAATSEWTVGAKDDVSGLGTR